MVELVTGHNREIAAWVAAHIPGCERGFTNPTAIGVLENGELIGGCDITLELFESGELQRIVLEALPQ